MTGEDFRKLVFTPPFRPVRITLVSGTSLVIRHPENIGVVGEMAMAATPDGQEFFELSQVASVKRLRNGR